LTYRLKRYKIQAVLNEGRIPQYFGMHGFLSSRLLEEKSGREEEMKENRLFVFVMGIFGMSGLVAGMYLQTFGPPHIGLSYFFVAFGSLILLFTFWKNRKSYKKSFLSIFVMIIGIPVVVIMPNSWHIAPITIACLVLVIALIGLISHKKENTKTT